MSPSVRIISPTDGQAVHGICPIVVEASGNQTISQVVVYQSGSVLERDVAAPYKILWNTRTEHDGTYTLMAKALDADFNEGTSATITVTVDNQPPTIELVPPSAGLAIGRIVELEARVQDAGGLAEVTWLLDGNAFASSPQAPYRVAWDTTAVSNGRHTLQAQAKDRAANQTNSEPLEVVVANPNHIPVLQPIGRQMVKEQERLVVALNATDEDGDRDPLTFQVSKLPPWASFDPKTRTISGAPGYDEASSAQLRKEYKGIRVQVCDPEPLCDAKEFAITVIDMNRPPVFEAPGAYLVNETDAVAIKLVFSDPDGDPLTCHAKNYPGWLRFEKETCMLRGQPPTDLLKQTEPQLVYPDVTFSVCDPYGLCVEQVSAITVQNVQNLPPVFEPIGRQVGEEKKRLVVMVRATDPEGEALSLETNEKALPGGMVFDDLSDGTAGLTWTPTAYQSGDYQVTVTVSDGAQTNEVVIPITIREVEHTISGKVADSSGSPLEGVEMKLEQNHQVVRETKTDRHGLYFFLDVRPATYDIRPGYTARASVDFLLVAQKQEGVNFTPSAKRVVITTQDARQINFVGLIGR